MRKDNAPPVTKGNNNDNARLTKVELLSFYAWRVFFIVFGIPLHNINKLVLIPGKNYVIL